jgi:hypothetical protein
MLPRRQETMHVYQAMRSTFKSLRTRKQVVDLGKRLGHRRAGSQDLRLFQLKSDQRKIDARGGLVTWKTYGTYLKWMDKIALERRQLPSLSCCMQAETKAFEKWLRLRRRIVSRLI